MPHSSRIAKVAVAAVVVLLVVMPLAVHLGWVDRMVFPRIWMRALVRNGINLDLYTTLLDPRRAGFGLVTVVGAMAFVVIAGHGDDRRPRVLRLIFAWIVLSMAAQVILWRWPGRLRTSVDASLYAMWAAVDLAQVGVGAILLGLLARSWRLAVGVVLSMALIVLLGYLTFFTRGGTWMVPGLDIGITVTSRLYSDAGRITSAFWQPVVALTLIALGLQEQRRWTERHSARCCFSCGYAMTAGVGPRCPECGWARTSSSTASA